MKPHDFIDNLNEASVAHNIALASKRSENYVQSLQQYSRALELYTKCLVFYKEKEGNTGYDPNEIVTNDGHNSASRGSEGTFINLELKISQTLQSMAKLQSKALCDDEAAINSHEDVISLLLQDTGADADNDRWKDHETVIVKSRQKSPTSVTQNQELMSSVCIIRLSIHERVRVISLSLSALGEIYFQQECQSPSHYNLKIKGNAVENSLRYYEESLKILSSITDPVSRTSVLALAHSQTDLSSASFPGQTYKIDLRLDIISNLIDIATVYKHRGEFQSVVNALEQARDLRLLSNCDVSDQEIIESMLAMAYENMGDFDNAVFCFQHALGLRKCLFGDQSIPVANLYSSISHTHRKLGDYYQALSWNKRAIAVYKDFVHHEDSTVAFNCRRHLIESLQSQGVTFIEMLEIDDAIGAYLAVIEAQIQFVGEEHPDVAKTLNGLGTLYTEKKDYLEAKAIFNRALSIYRKYGPGTNEPGLLETLKSLSDLDKILEEQNFGLSTIKKESEHNEPMKTTQIHISLPSSEQRCGTIVETNGSFEDDTVSQITFVTHKEFTPSALITESKKTYDYDTWAPAEYVFHAVNQLASAAEDFLSGPTLRRSKQSSKPIATSSKRQAKPKKKNWRRAGDFECAQHNLSDRSSSSPLTPKDRESLNLFQSVHVATSSNALQKARNTMNDDLDDNSTLLGSVLINSVLGYDDDPGPVPRQSLTYSKICQQRSSEVIRNDDESTLFGTRYANGQDDDGTLPSAQVIENEPSVILKAHKIKTQSNDSHYSRAHLDVINEGVCRKVDQLNYDMDSDAKPFENLFHNEQEFKDSSDEHVRSTDDDYFERLNDCLDSLIDLRDCYGSEHTKVIEKTQELANLYISSGNTEKGTSTFREVVALYQKKYGENCVQAAESLVMMGQQLARHENYSTAIQTLTEAKDVEITTFGSFHPRISRLMNEIGLVYLSNDDYDSAMECFLEALEIQAKNIFYEEINKDISKTYLNTGRCYLKECKVQTKKRSANKWKSFFTADVLEKIASAYSERGEYMIAIRFYQEILNMYQTRSSVQSNVKIYNLLGEAYCNTGQYDLAKNQHSRALEAIKDSKSPDQLEFFITQVRLATVDYHMGKIKESSIALEHCVEVLSNTLEDNQSQSAKALFHLAVVKRMQYDLNHSYQLINQALKIQKSNLYPNHQDIILSEIELSKILLEQNRFEEARATLDHVYTKELNEYGRDIPHPNLALCLHYLGVCHSLQDNDKKAMKYYEHAYRMYREVQYSDTLVFALTLDEIASMFIKMGRFEKASSLLEDSLRIRRGISEDHFECCYSLLGIGILLANQLNYPEAIHMYEKARSIASSSLGLDHPFIADIHLEMGIVHTRRCHFDEGKSELEKAIQIYRKFQFSESHVKLKKAAIALNRNIVEEGLCV